MAVALPLSRLRAAMVVLYWLAMLERVSPRLTLCTRCWLDLPALTGEVFPLAAGELPLAVVFEEAAACEACAASALAEVLEPLLACVPALAFTLPARVEDEGCRVFGELAAALADCLPAGL